MMTLTMVIIMLKTADITASMAPPIADTMAPCSQGHREDQPSNQEGEGQRTISKGRRGGEKGIGWFENRRE